MLSLYDGSIKFTTNKKCTNRKSFIKISPRLSKRQSCDNIIKAQHIQILQTKHLMVLIGVIKMRGKSKKGKRNAFHFPHHSKGYHKRVITAAESHDMSYSIIVLGKRLCATVKRLCSSHDTEVMHNPWVQNMRAPYVTLIHEFSYKCGSKYDLWTDIFRNLFVVFS